MVWDFSSDVESGFSVMPAGSYNVVVSDVKMKETKNGDNRANLTFTVLDGAYQGRKLFSGFNVELKKDHGLEGEEKEKREKSIQIGRSQLKSIAKVGNKDLTKVGPEDLLGIEMSVSVKIRPAANGYNESNDVGSFKPKTQSEPASGVPF